MCADVSGDIGSVDPSLFVPFPENKGGVNRVPDDLSGGNFVDNVNDIYQIFSRLRRARKISISPLEIAYCDNFSAAFGGGKTHQLDVIAKFWAAPADPADPSRHNGGVNWKGGVNRTYIP